MSYIICSTTDFVNIVCDKEVEYSSFNIAVAHAKARAEDKIRALKKEGITVYPVCKNSKGSVITLREFGDKEKTHYMIWVIDTSPITQIRRLRMVYPEGAVIVLDEMDDIQAPPAGTKGTVEYIDDAGNIHMIWENGSSLALVLGKDKFHLLIEPQE